MIGVTASTKSSIGAGGDACPPWLPWALAAVGVSVRLLFTTRGFNGDVEAWQLVAGLVHDGQNVYASTTHYNYGPVWFHVLHALWHVSGKEPGVFRVAVAALLSLVDVGIFSALWRRLGRMVAISFLFNPISVLLTGYHRQMDNLALLLGILAVLLIGDRVEGPLSWRKVSGLALLGVSISTKHILFAFPLWIAVKQKGLLSKLAFLAIPTGLFLLAFVPYWADGRDGIIENVFLYVSRHHEHLYRSVVPSTMQLVLSARLFWLLALALGAVLFRRWNTLDSLLVYTCLLVATSPALANQYLAIPVPFVAANPNPFTFLFTVAGTCHLLVDADGLHVGALSGLLGAGRDWYYTILVHLLVLGLVWSVAKRLKASPPARPGGERSGTLLSPK